MPTQKGVKIVAKYSGYIMKNIRQNIGLDENDTSRDAEIESMSGRDILDKYLTWEGIIGYTDEILDVVIEAFPDASDKIDY